MNIAGHKIERLCVFCQHINLNEIGCWGDYPDPATFECLKGHFQGIEGMESDFRKAILRAETCKDYEQVKP